MKKTVRDVRKILEGHPPEEGNLIPILQKVQEKYGYLSPEAVKLTAEYLRITENRVFGVASFYSQFRFTPRGRHSVTVCLGTACHVRGGEILLDAIERELEIRTGECTSDRKYDLDRVACLGCCALAPVLKVDNDVYGNVTVVKIREILDQYE